MIRRVAPTLALAAVVLAGLPAAAGAEYRYGYAVGDGAAQGVAVDKGGEVYATIGNQVEKFSPGGTLVDTFGGGQLNNPDGIAVGPDGAVYVADTGNNRVERFSATGGSPAAVGAGLTAPLAVEVDGA